MRVEVVDNVTRTMVDALSSVMERTADLRMAVAFMSRRGLSMIEAPLMSAVDSGTPVELLVGLDMRSTEPEALQELFQVSRRKLNLSMYCYADLSQTGIYHPKLYISRVAESVSSIIGSSNLTEGGLKRNVEVNVLIEAAADDEVVSDIYMTYNKLKFHPERVEPDDEFLDLYAQRCEVEKREQRRARRDSDTRRLREVFSKKARSLRRPTATSRDLVGWLELVYDSLPDREFTNQEVYQREAEFQRRYPGNRNVKAKVRQQLQVLEAMGFVEHVRTGRWRKL